MTESDSQSAAAAAADDPVAVVAALRRSLEDLLAFEGRRFVVPADAGGDEPLVSPPPTAAAASGPPAAVSAAPASEPDPGPATAPASPAPTGVAADDLETFRQAICDCTKCALGLTRTSFVFGSGSPEAGILFVGEAPGQEEDRRGLPFVGPAGELLTKIIEAMGLRRDEVYICNVLKCRPPNNRDPQPEEVAECEPYLQRQIDIVRPRVICCLGRHAAHALLQTDTSLSRLRDRQHDYHGTPLIVTYHPAALLRNPGYKRATWEDVKRVRRIYDGTEL